MVGAMGPDRDKTFEALVREIGKSLTSEDGWREDEAERVVNGRVFVRDLDAPLRVAVDLLFDTDEETGSRVLDGVVSVGCVAAQEVLDLLDSPASAVIERVLVDDAGEELAIELSRELRVHDTARGVTALVRDASAELAAEAGTVDDFLACVAADRDRVGEVERVTVAVLAVSGRVEEARARVPRLEIESGHEFAERFTSWLAGDFVAAEPAEVRMPSFAEEVARVRAREEALAVMDGLGPSADLEARRAALVAALEVRGVQATPYWIERHAIRERLSDSAGFMRLVRDGVRVLRSIGEGERSDGEPVAIGRGPWLRVTLDRDADARLERAYRTGSRIGDLATVTVRLRSSDATGTTTVVLDGVEVGHVQVPPSTPDDIAVRAQIGRLPSAPPYHLQLQLP
jgi:hypothetical protein